MKKMLFFVAVLLILAVPSAKANNDEVEYLYDVHSRNLLLLRGVLLDEEDELTIGEAFDYIESNTKFTRLGIDELQELDENTEYEELLLKEQSLELIELTLEHKSDK